MISPYTFSCMQTFVHILSSMTVYVNQNWNQGIDAQAMLVKLILFRNIVAV